MPTIDFYKYQGTGNDFVMIDNRDLTFPKNPNLIHKLCDRRFGIGGDGLILLEKEEDSGFTDFRMVYYNSDGNESTMCGNGGRCLVAFAHFLNIFEKDCIFTAIDGTHEAIMDGNSVKIKMIDIPEINTYGGDYILNTGSPHYVKRLSNVADVDVLNEGKKIRNSTNFVKEGINVNFLEVLAPQQLFVRTFERGVEGETYSCGTGVTASALTYFLETGATSAEIKTLGGMLHVYAEPLEKGFCNVWLKGPAEQVFKGYIHL